MNSPYFIVMFILFSSNSYAKILGKIKLATYLKPAIFTQVYPIKFYILSISEKMLKRIKHKDLRIGLLRGAAYFDQLDNDATLIKVKVSTIEQLIGMLLKGRIDTFLGREESINPIIERIRFKHKLKVSLITIIKV